MSSRSKPIFEDYIAFAQFAGTLELRCGDMFSDDWPQADVFILGHISMTGGWRRRSCDQAGI